MKNWLTIGQVSKAVGVSAKALRLYESIGLIQSHARGENNYRYYELSQLAVLRRLKEFKDLGFTLAEIKSLLETNWELDSEKLSRALRNRLEVIKQQSEVLLDQKNQIESILSSLHKKTEPLKAQQRRAIMSLYGKVSILVTGCDGLEKTARYVQQYFKNSGQDVPIVFWKSDVELPVEKPFILVATEQALNQKETKEINADVIVVKNISSPSTATIERYLNLFGQIGPHVNTVLNADDGASIKLAGKSQVQKGRIFYYSKNKALAPQIKHIGGILSDGEELEMHGFNLKTDLSFRLSETLSFENEIALISSLAAVMTVGFEQEQLQLPELELKST